MQGVILGPEDSILNKAKTHILLGVYTLWERQSSRGQRRKQPSVSDGVKVAGIFQQLHTLARDLR